MQNPWIYNYLAKEGKTYETLQKNLIKGTKAEMLTKAQEIGLILDDSKSKADMAADVVSFLMQSHEEQALIEQEPIAEEPTPSLIEEETKEPDAVILEETSIILSIVPDDIESPIIAMKEDTVKTSPDVRSIFKALAPIVSKVSQGALMVGIWLWYQVLMLWDVVRFYGPDILASGLKVGRVALTALITLCKVSAKVGLNISATAIRVACTAVLVACGACVTLARLACEGWAMREAIIAESRVA